MKGLVLRMAGMGGALGALLRLGLAISALRPRLREFQLAAAGSPDPVVKSRADALADALSLVERASDEARRLLKL